MCVPAARDEVVNVATLPDVVLTEILALSKMNWNSADFSLAKPITLLFSRKVGEVMTSLPESVNPRHEYLYYM